MGMKNYRKIFEVANEAAKISFKVLSEKGEIYTSEGFNIKSTFAKESIDVFGEEFIIIVNSKDKSVLPLLGQFILSAIREEVEKENSLIKDIIQGSDYSKSEIKRLYPFMCKDFILIVISIDNSIKECIAVIEDGYESEDICILNYKNNILILGNLDEPYEHAESLKETLEYNTKEKCVISYMNVSGYENLSDAVKKSIRKIDIAKKYDIKNKIINENSIEFEAILNSIDLNKLLEVVRPYEEGLDKLDEEMMKSIETFLDCGLNVSESAKRLYIHRNTLIYRIEKLERYTGFDIKNFNEAVTFKILYTLWKEKNKQKIFR
ncbi:PucR C-terminal helix-turn-helix domain-containing protein [Clostridium sp. DSM 8431]|nr:PucR C-terminal helix-turn-helix domain-containing protein [Clostridium sp. DSM 8431]